MAKDIILLCAITYLHNPAPSRKYKTRNTSPFAQHVWLVYQTTPRVSDPGHAGPNISYQYPDATPCRHAPPETQPRPPTCSAACFAAAAASSVCLGASEKARRERPTCRVRRGALPQPGRSRRGLASHRSCMRPRILYSHNFAAMHPPGPSPEQRSCLSWPRGS